MEGVSQPTRYLIRTSEGEEGETRCTRTPIHRLSSYRAVLDLVRSPFLPTISLRRTVCRALSPCMLRWETTFEETLCYPNFYSR